MDRNIFEQSFVTWKNILNSNRALLGMNLYLINNYARYEQYKAKWCI
jgi:hypothetical protein